MALLDEEILIKHLLRHTLNFVGEVACWGAGAWEGGGGSRVLGLNLLKDLLLINTGECILVKPDVSFGWVVILTASLSHNFEPIYLWLVVINLRWEDDGLGVVLQEVVREARAKERTINIDRPELWNVNFLAPWAINLES